MDRQKLNCAVGDIESVQLWPKQTTTTTTNKYKYVRNKQRTNDICFSSIK